MEGLRPEQSSSGAALSVRALTVRFGGITALDGVSLGVAGGEVVGVIGPNGAGKTTLFNAVCGFVRPSAGTISWRGATVGAGRPDRLAALGIARTLQGVGLFSGLSVLENVMAGAERFRRTGAVSAMLALPRSAREERALRARALASLQTVECAELAERPPGSLPLASQKRVALARALVSEPALLLLDEPAGGLDAGELSRLAEIVRALRGSRAIMLVEHHMDFVASVCDRLVVLDFGRVIASGEPRAVRSDPRVLEAYLGRDAAGGSAAEPARRGSAAPAAGGAERDDAGAGDDDA